MKSHSHISFWLASFLVSVFLIPLFTSAQSTNNRLWHERDALAGIFGEHVTGLIESTVEPVYAAVVVQSHVQDAVRASRMDEKDLKQSERVMSVAGRTVAEASNGYFAALGSHIYAVFYRGTIMFAWMVILSPFLIAALVDGLVMRRIRHIEFSAPKPTGFAIGFHVLVLMCALPLMYLSVPLAVTPLFMPMWVLFAIAPFMLMLAHTQRLFGR
jgi:hypothetical protein